MNLLFGEFPCGCAICGMLCSFGHNMLVSVWPAVKQILATGTLQFLLKYFADWQGKAACLLKRFGLTVDRLPGRIRFGNQACNDPVLLIGIILPFPDCLGWRHFTEVKSVDDRKSNI